MSSVINLAHTNLTLSNLGNLKEISKDTELTLFTEFTLYNLIGCFALNGKCSIGISYGLCLGSSPKMTVSEALVR